MLSRWMTIGLLGAAACGKVTNETPDAATPDAPPGPATVTLTNQTFDGSGTTADTGLVAYQDGDGPWQAVTGTAGVYTLTVSQPRYSVAIACGRDAPTPFAYVQVYHYTVAEAPKLYALEECANTTVANVTISGTVAGLPMTDTAIVSDGYGSYGGSFTTFNMSAPPGPGTLVAVHRSSNRAVGLLVQKPTYVEGQTFALDFASQVFPAESNITFDPTATTPSMSTYYYDENGASFSIDSASGVVPTYRVMPSDRVGAGISMVSVNASAGGVSRSVRHYFKTPAAQTMTLPPAFQPAAPQVAATTPYVMPTMSLPVQAGASHYYASFSSSSVVGNASAFRDWYIVYSAGWLGAATAVQVTTPDLSALPGWGDWGLQATNRSWSAAAYTGPIAAMPNVTSHDGRGRQPGLWKDGDVATTSSTSGSF